MNLTHENYPKILHRIQVRSVHVIVFSILVLPLVWMMSTSLLNASPTVKLPPPTFRVEKCRRFMYKSLLNEVFRPCALVLVMDTSSSMVEPYSDTCPAFSTPQIPKHQCHNS
uniref:VWFA domain-containing protein n=1 Tax=Heterorhabditis bacteriophora TaxID=37862 RepID=A0A1I7XDR0_HETBA